MNGAGGLPRVFARAFLNTIPIAMIAVGLDYVVHGVSSRDNFTPIATIVITLFISLPVNLYFLHQRALMKKARDDLLEIQAARDAAKARLEVALVAAESANAAKSTFLATMSHEIRTPLNGVLGMAQAMARGDLNTDQRERLSVIQGSGQALLAILNDVLDFSKIEAGKLEIETIDFDLGEVLHLAHTTFEPLARGKGVGIHIEAEDAEGIYRGDPTRIRQILFNLISNAVKFTEAGDIRIRAARTAGGIEIAVRDSGIGMAPDVLAHLFSSFTQADAATARRFGGTGLGLAICQQLASLMGGRIDVRSQVGEGSVFTLAIPLAFVGAAQAKDAAVLAADPSEPPPTGLRVLAGEDNPTNRLVLKTLLQDHVGEIVLVEDGRRVVDRWREGDFDVILMDIQMPVMDGLAATRAIREAEAETGRRRTPIIALTANAMAHQIEDYQGADMDGHVAKPIEVGKLFDALAKVLDDAEPHAAVG